MEKEEKQLLFKDICARLPYGVYVLVHDTFEYSTVPYENVYLKSSDISSLIDSISLNERYNSKDKQFNRIIKERKDFLEFKPFLRPMSSMTEEEREEYWKFVEHRKILYDNGSYDGARNILRLDIPNRLSDFTDWLNSHHFDYRGLIEKGLAIEAPKGTYETE